MTPDGQNTELRGHWAYKARRHDQAAIEAKIKEICTTRVRYGYRRDRRKIGGQAAIAICG